MRALLLALVVACGATSETTSTRDDAGAAPDSGGSPPQGPPTLWFSPPHLATLTGDTPVRANLRSNGKYLTSEVAAVAAEVELRIADGLALVPTDAITVQNIDPYSAYIELRPKSPLRPTWHVLSLKSVPNGVLLDPASSVPPPVGAYGTKFHPASQPVLVQVLMCHAPSKIKVVFELSEPVTTPVAPDSVETYARVEQGTKKCTFVRLPMQAPDLKYFDQECADFTATDPWRVILNPGLKSPLGIAVTTPGGAPSLDRSVDFAALPDHDGCKTFRAER